MPWPLPLVGRLLVTHLGLLVLLRLLPGTAPGGHWAAGLLLAAVGTGIAYAVWRRATWPRRPPGMLHSVPDSAQPYQRDLHARLTLDRRGYLFSRRVMFSCAGRWTSLRRVPADYDLRFIRPVAVHSTGGRTWWAVGNEYYWANDTLRAETVEAVVDSLRWRRRARLDVDHVDLDSTAEDRRQRILDGLRPNFSKHNGLVCIRCRGVIDLREEPVAPVWTDGGVKVADLQLLCSRCHAAARGRRARPSVSAAAAETAAAARSTYSF